MSKDGDKFPFKRERYLLYWHLLVVRRKTLALSRITILQWSRVVINIVAFPCKLTQKYDDIECMNISTAVMVSVLNNLNNTQWTFDVLSTNHLICTTSFQFIASFNVCILLPYLNGFKGSRIHRRWILCPECRMHCFITTV